MLATQTIEDSEDLEENELAEVIPIHPSQSVISFVDGIKTTEIIDAPETSSATSPSLPSPPSPLLQPLSLHSLDVRKPGLFETFRNKMTSLCRSSAKTVREEHSSGARTSAHMFANAGNRDENETPLSQPQSRQHFLEMYWNMIKFPKAKDNGNRWTALIKILKFVWILLFSLTIFDTITRIKDSVLDVGSDKTNVERTQAKLVKLAYRITQFLLKISFIIASTKDSSITTDVFKHLTPGHPKMIFVPCTVIFATFAISLGCTIGGLGIIPLDKAWSLDRLTFYHFFSTYDRLCVWSSSEEMPEVYSMSLLYAGALLGYVMHFASRFIELTIQCLLLLTILSFFFEVKEASGHLKSFNQKLKTLDQEDGLVEVTRLGETIMMEYENQRDLTKEMNAAFRLMYAFIHCTNLTLFVYWGHEAYTSFEIGGFVWAGIEVGIFGVAYILAICVANMASGYEDWILNKKTREVMNIDGSQFVAMLHEITKSPIGIGSGILYINFDFIVKFIVLAFNSFVLLLRAAAAAASNR